MKCSIGVIALAVSSVSAADLASELAAWGPLATSATRSIKDGHWFMHGSGMSTSGERMNGLARIDRDAGLDGEIVIGWAQDGGEDFQYFPTYDVLRAYCRVGTDPLAAEAGEPLVSVGGVFAAPILLSAQGQFGWSADRGVVGEGEISLFPIRVRCEVDDDVQTIRVGSGPRLIGSTAPWAWGALIDWAATTVEDGHTEEGAIIEGYLFYRAWNHVVLGVQISDFIHVGDHDDLVRAAFLVGGTF